MPTQSRTPKRTPALSEDQKKKRQAELELREQKKQEALSCFQNLEEFRSKTREERDKLLQMENVALGLYDEIDKLTKKAPAEPVTDLALESLNYIISETKAIARADVYVDRIKIFVAAGNNPQLRDAIIVLRQLRDGLKRYRELSDNLLKRANDLLPTAKFLAVALDIYIKNGGNIDDSEIEKIIQNYSLYGSRNNIERWLSGRGDQLSLNFERIDQVDITAHFSLN